MALDTPMHEPILVQALKEKVARELYDQILKEIEKRLKEAVHLAVMELNISADTYYTPHNLRQEVHYILHEGKNG